jgi:predicted GNAT superfamily acetyltransferase
MFCRKLSRMSKGARRGARIRRMTMSDSAGFDGDEHGSISIELVTTVAGTVEALETIARVWGPDGARDIDLYFVIAGHGGYLAIARRRGAAVGASFGFLSDGGRGLHSHMTGVVPGALGQGVGSALKEHQRGWCADRGIDHITWTFDPLVRRNARFNLLRLGAEVKAYHSNYYGALSDDLNVGDETDRLDAWWSVADAAPRSPVVAGDDDLVIATPPDIESLRRGDPHAAGEWRRRVRDAMLPALGDGYTVVGLDGDGSYVLSLTASKGPL